MKRKTEQPNLDEGMRKTAVALIDVALAAFMKVHDVDHKTAQRWMVSAVETAVEGWKPIPKNPRHKKPKARRVVRMR